MQTLTAVQKAPCNNTALCRQPFRSQIVNTVAIVDHMQTYAKQQQQQSQ